MSFAVQYCGEVVHFPSEICVSVVPHFWFDRIKKNICAWPRQYKIVAKFIVNC